MICRFWLAYHARTAGARRLLTLPYRQHRRLLRPCWDNPGEKRGKNRSALVLSELPNDLARSVVDGTEGRPVLVLTRGRHAHGMSASARDLCHVGKGVEVALIHVYLLESGSGKSPYSWSSVSRCPAQATTSASFQGVRCRYRCPGRSNVR